MTPDVFHPLQAEGPLPPQLNSPFCYEPHPLCVEAFRMVREHVAHSELAEEVAGGKMLGVLVCQTADGVTGFLAAYSGQLGGREDWPWFVPAVFDYLQPDGYFKREEAAISAINRRISKAEASPEAVALRQACQQLEQQATEALTAMKEQYVAARALRHERRQLLSADQEEEQEALTRESQHQKAELRRLKHLWQQRTDEARQQLALHEKQIAQMREERRRRSDALQRWLFDQFVMVDEWGEKRTLTSIFADTPQQLPPAGAGECCAPKLLQYAFLHGMRPVAMAEFWQGRSPRTEVRHHGQHYPACRGKCKPILDWMLHLPPESDAPDHAPVLPPPVYEDESIIVVDKPAGLLSVPGRTGETSVEEQLRRTHGEVWMVHRLDQDTSGLLVAALTQQAYHHLQRQFLERTVCKKYIALLDGTVECGRTVSLSLRPDLNDRPRQLADCEHGKEAVTVCEVIATEHDGRTRMALTPLTGRTHQLRVHCAHEAGLATPIVGDRLYGKPAQRLCLHAAELAFTHPLTGERLSFVSPPPF